MPDVNPQDRNVIILTGEFAGEEGICLGPASDRPGWWAVSPHASNKVLTLKLGDDFGILLNSGQEPGRN